MSISPMVGPTSQMKSNIIYVDGRVFPAKSEDDAKYVLGMMLLSSTAEKFVVRDQEIQGDAGSNISFKEKQQLDNVLNAYSEIPATRNFSLVIRQNLEAAKAKTQKRHPDYSIDFNDVMSNPFLNSFINDAKDTYARPVQLRRGLEN